MDPDLADAMLTSGVLLLVVALRRSSGHGSTPCLKIS
jgi:hypothetical protein